MELLLVLAIILTAVAGLAMGQVLGRGRVKGSCGGMACLKDHDCEVCPNRHRKEHES